MALQMYHLFNYYADHDAKLATRRARRKQERIDNPEKVRAADRARHWRHRDSRNAKTRASWAKHREKRVAELRKRYQEHHDEIRQARRLEYARNPEKYKALQRALRAAKPEFYNAEASFRRALRQRAVPPWGDATLIARIYAEAKSEGVVSGTSICVDHIYPLVHKRFCGLHVQWNLQMLPQLDNAHKLSNVPQAAFHPVVDGQKIYTGVQL